MLVPVILILGVLWLTVVLVFVGACRMAARGDSALRAGAADRSTTRRPAIRWPGYSQGDGLTVWESLPASACQGAPRRRAQPIARGARGHAGRSAAGS